MSDAPIGVIDIGATKVLVGLANSEGHLLPEQARRIATPDEPEALLDQLAEAFAELDSGPLSVVSCVAPGPLDPGSGMLVRLQDRAWADVPLTRLLGAQLHAPVLLEDDATAAALGEAVRGAGAGHDPVAYLTVSSGVGAGIVVGGASLRGAHGLAGEVGHIVIDPSGPPCGCGRKGDVEAYAGGHSLARIAAATWPEEKLADGTPAPRTAREIFALARRGDSRAAEVIRDAAHALALAIAAIVSVADPELVVVGGGIALAEPDWINAIAARAGELCMKETASSLHVVPAGLGPLSALAGAAVLGARHLREDR